MIPSQCSKHTALTVFALQGFFFERLLVLSDRASGDAEAGGDQASRSEQAKERILAAVAQAFWRGGADEVSELYHVDVYYAVELSVRFTA